MHEARPQTSSSSPPSSRRPRCLARVLVQVARPAPRSPQSCCSRCSSCRHSPPPEEAVRGRDRSRRGTRPAPPPSFTATLTNETSTQQLGSANLTLPPGFTPLSVGTPSVGTATLVGSTVQLRNLATPPGASASVSVSAQGAVPPRHVHVVGHREAGQRLHRRPRERPDLRSGEQLPHHHAHGLVPPRDRVHVAARGCADRHRHHDRDVRSVGSARERQVLDGNGNPIPSSTAPITLSIVNNPGGGSLSGTTDGERGRRCGVLPGHLDRRAGPQLHPRRQHDGDRDRPDRFRPVQRRQRGQEVCRGGVLVRDRDGGDHQRQRGRERRSRR